ncbi:hypothetical protein RRG08_010198 [Elysia crispata]|uniref:Uncharacterized protein n=1 Tax=Elysia crispata TaxID=231223 RepID=A0AAE1AJH1_9GAST|nr:hypothetical protein RRG08_010198 [Elysia crispata]
MQMFGKVSESFPTVTARQLTHEEERGSPLKGERDESNGSHSYKKVSLIDFVGTYEEGTVYAVKREYQR